jgi:hypothetical protein
MRASPLAVAAVTTAFALVTSAAAQADWALDVFLGGAWNLPTPLVIEQTGHPDLEVHARYRTRAFELPLYYAARVARWRGDEGLALELVHHKIELRDPPPEVERFDVSHGYNLLLVEAMRRTPRVDVGLGAGVVVARPEVTVRGRPAGRYELSGPVACALLGHAWQLGHRWRASAEIRFTAARARVGVAGGEAFAPNLALHALVGVGLASGP